MSERSTYNWRAFKEKVLLSGSGITQSQILEDVPLATMPAVTIDVNPEDIEGPSQLIAEIIKGLHSTHKKKLLYLIALGLGAMASGYEFVLSSNFGARAANYIETNKTGEWALRGFFAGEGALMAMALVSLPLRDFLLEELDFNSEKYVAASKHPVIRKLVIYFSRFASALSPLPFAYVLKKSFEGDLPAQISFALAAFVVSIACSSLGQRPYLNALFQRWSLEPEEIKIKRKRLANKYAEIEARLRNASTFFIETLYQFSKEHLSDANFDSEFVHKLKTFLNVTHQVIEKEKEPFSKTKFALDCICVAGGTAASSFLFYYSLAALEELSFGVGLSDSQGLNVTEKILAGISVYPNCLFFGGFVQRRVEDYFNKWRKPGFQINSQTSHPTLRAVSNYLSLVPGLVSAVPHVDASIQSYENGESNVELIPVTAIGITLAQAKAIDLLIQDGIDTYDYYLLEKSPAFRRDFLIKVFSSISYKVLTTLHPDKINYLYSLFCENNHSPHNASTEKSEAIVRSESSLQSIFSEGDTPVSLVSKLGKFKDDKKLSITTSVSAPNLCQLSSP